MEHLTIAPYFWQWTVWWLVARSDWTRLSQSCTRAGAHSRPPTTGGQHRIVGAEISRHLRYSGHIILGRRQSRARSVTIYFWTLHILIHMANNANPSQAWTMEHNKDNWYFQLLLSSVSIFDLCLSQTYCCLPEESFNKTSCCREKIEAVKSQIKYNWSVLQCFVHKSSLSSLVADLSWWKLISKHQLLQLLLFLQSLWLMQGQCKFSSWLIHIWWKDLADLRWSSGNAGELWNYLLPVSNDENL